MTQANHSHCSLKKSDVSDFLISLSKNEQLAKTILFRCTKEQFERIANLALYKIVIVSCSRSCSNKRATRAIHCFLRVYRCFAHKKRAICSKNQRANSQPCKTYMNPPCCSLLFPRHIIHISHFLTSRKIGENSTQR